MSYLWPRQSNRVCHLVDISRQEVRHFLTNSNAPLANQSPPNAQPEPSFNRSSFYVPSVSEKYAQKTALNLALKELKITDGTEPQALLKVIRKMLDLHALPGCQIPFSILFCSLIPMVV